MDAMDKISDMVKQDRVFLFMKGSPDLPQCGFSATVVQILNEMGVKFGHFDVLSDEEIRQGAKEFSDWPTFPQLYVGGKLVGGCDIVVEMSRNGELKKALS